MEEATIPATFNVLMRSANEMPKTSVRINAHLGDTISIRCATDGMEIANQRWILNGDIVPGQESTNHDVHSTEFSIDAVKMSHFGLLECHGNGKRGREVSALIRLVQADKEEFVSGSDGTNGFVKCSSQFASSYCQNGGTCFSSSTQPSYFACLCPKTTYGSQCQNFHISTETRASGLNANEFGKELPACPANLLTALSMAGLFTVLLLILFFFLGVMFIFWRRRMRVKKQYGTSSESYLSSLITGMSESFGSKSVYSPMSTISDLPNLEKGFTAISPYRRSDSNDETGTIAYKTQGKQQNESKSDNDLKQYLYDIKDLYIDDNQKYRLKHPNRRNACFNIKFESFDKIYNHGGVDKRRASLLQLSGELLDVRRRRPSAPNIKYFLIR